MADAAGIENPLFHVQVRLPDGEQITREQWEHNHGPRFENIPDWKASPRPCVSRRRDRPASYISTWRFQPIDDETLKAKPLPFFKLRLKALARAA